MNLFDYTVPQKGETFTTLLEHKNIKIIRIVSSDNFESVEYVQEEDEWVVLLEGEAILMIEGEKKTLKKGESLLIPAKIPHRVLEMNRGTVWLAVHIF
ncbi:cupin domain-containing protein [Sulfurovum sp. bin170]|uniref:cupin domain-containing protein n=1 Tax=Sulfurovum sp. bin170 TaxID=2695268 RepID=UPI0013E03010|nr:cupin domain-containing protein [Sulfurovum sp. bin170]